MIRQNSIYGLILLLASAWPLCALSSTDQLTTGWMPEADLERGKKLYPLCASCHMDNGWGKKDGSFPVIAGQHQKVLLKQLEDIRTRKRENPTMFPFSDAQTMGGDQAMMDVTAYIASMKPNPSPGVGDGKQLALGKNLYEKRCVQCHGETGIGNSDALYPRISNQHYAYLLRQLIWIRDGYRKNSHPLMLDNVKGLSNDELSAIADYVSRL
jgi:cytochrome c553